MPFQAMVGVLRSTIRRTAPATGENAKPLLRRGTLAKVQVRKHRYKHHDQLVDWCHLGCRTELQVNTTHWLEEAFGDRVTD